MMTADDQTQSCMVLLQTLLMAAQAIRIAQVNFTPLERRDLRDNADEAWEDFNRSHRELTEGVQRLLG